MIPYADCMHLLVVAAIFVGWDRWDEISSRIGGGALPEWQSGKARLRAVASTENRLPKFDLAVTADLRYGLIFSHFRIYSNFHFPFWDIQSHAK